MYIIPMIVNGKKEDYDAMSFDHYLDAYAIFTLAHEALGGKGVDQVTRNIFFPCLIDEFARELLTKPEDVQRLTDYADRLKAGFWESWQKAAKGVPGQKNDWEMNFKRCREDVRRHFFQQDIAMPKARVN